MNSAMIIIDAQDSILNPDVLRIFLWDLTNLQERRLSIVSMITGTINVAEVAAFSLSLLND